MSRPSRPGSVRSPRRHLCAERRPEPFRAVCFCAVKPRTAFALRALSRAGRARWSPASLRSDRSPARRTATWRRLRRAAAKASGQADESQQDVGPAGVVHGALEAQPAAAGALRLVDHVPRCHVHQEGVAASEHLGVRKRHKANFGDVWELVRHTEEPRRLAGVSAAPRPVLEAGGARMSGWRRAKLLPCSLKPQSSWLFLSSGQPSFERSGVPFRCLQNGRNCGRSGFHDTLPVALRTMCTRVVMSTLNWWPPRKKKVPDAFLTARTVTPRPRR